MDVSGWNKSTGARVVEDMEGGSRAILLEMFVARFPGFGDLQGLLVLEKLGVNGVGVVVVEYKDILVSA